MSTTTEGGPLWALARKLSGGTLLFEKLDTSQVPGTALISPSKVGSIHLLKLNGTSEWYIQKRAFLACTSQLSLLAKIQGLGWVTCCRIAQFLESGWIV